MRFRRILAVATVSVLVVVSGCAGFGGGDDGHSTSTAFNSGTTTLPSTASTAPTTVSRTTTSTATSSSVLTDRTPSTRLELHPEAGFTGRIRVALDGDEVYNETFDDYAGFNETDLSDEFHDDAGYEVYVIVTTQNDTQVWRTSLGETEGYELDVHKNGTIEVRYHVIG